MNEQKGKGDKVFQGNKVESRYIVRQKGEGKQKMHSQNCCGEISKFP